MSAMAQMIFVVMAGKESHQPDSAFSREADASAYALRQNNLEKQRHPHSAVIWQVHSLEVDARC